MFQRHHTIFDWLLDVAHGTASNLTGARQRDAVGRVRASIRRLDNGPMLVDLAPNTSAAVGTQNRPRGRSPTEPRSRSSGRSRRAVPRSRQALREGGRVVTPPLNYRDAARMLGIPVGTLRSMVCRRQVPHIRMSARIVVFDVAARRVDRRAPRGRGERRCGVRGRWRPRGVGSPSPERLPCTESTTGRPMHNSLCRR